MSRKMFVCIILLIIVLSFLCFIVVNEFIESKKLKTEKEIIDIFKMNKESFIKSSDNLYKVQFHWSIRKERYDETVRPDWKGCVFKNGIQLVIHEEEYFDEILSIQEIVGDNSYIEKVIKKLKFKIITNNASIDEGCIYFIKQTAIGFDSGIIYCPVGKPKNSYITKFTQIEESWFYYEIRG